MPIPQVYSATFSDNIAFSQPNWLGLDLWVVTRTLKVSLDGTSPCFFGSTRLTCVVIGSGHLCFLGNGLVSSRSTLSGLLLVTIKHRLSCCQENLNSQQYEKMLIIELTKDISCSSTKCLAWWTCFSSMYVPSNVSNHRLITQAKTT